jgi:hypothetical protein
LARSAHVFTHQASLVTFRRKNEVFGLGSAL